MDFSPNTNQQYSLESGNRCFVLPVLRFALADLAVLQPDCPDGEKPGITGVDHVAYTYASLDDLFDNYQQLKAEGIAPHWCVHHGLTVSMYYADPDGNQMEFQVEVFDSSAEAVAFMCGPKMAENPVGVEYDPQEWLAQKRAGKPLSEFLVREVHEPISPIRGELGAGTSSRSPDSRTDSNPNRYACANRFTVGHLLHVMKIWSKTIMNRSASGRYWCHGTKLVQPRVPAVRFLRSTYRFCQEKIA